MGNYSNMDTKTCGVCKTIVGGEARQAPHCGCKFAYHHDCITQQHEDGIVTRSYLKSECKSCRLQSHTFVGFKCPNCPATKSTMSILAAHMRLRHPNAGYCTYCTPFIKFNTDARLKNHLECTHQLKQSKEQEHQGQATRPFVSAEIETSCVTPTNTENSELQINEINLTAGTIERESFEPITPKTSGKTQRQVEKTKTAPRKSMFENISSSAAEKAVLQAATPKKQPAPACATKYFNKPSTSTVDPQTSSKKPSTKAASPEVGKKITKLIKYSVVPFSDGTSTKKRKVVFSLVVTTDPGSPTTPDKTYWDELMAHAKELTDESD